MSLLPDSTNDDHNDKQDHDLATPLAPLLSHPTSRDIDTYFLADTSQGRSPSLPKPTPNAFKSKILSRTNMRAGQVTDKSDITSSSSRSPHKNISLSSPTSLAPQKLPVPDTSLSGDIINRVLILPGISRPESPSTQYSNSVNMASTISSPSSRDEFDYGSDGMMSQVILSSEEDEEQTQSSTIMPETASASSMFVMPSIPMPSRKPFTERGKQLGRFKVLIAGAQGTGKTSLIRAISQTCQDIVHIDETPSSLFTYDPKPRSRSSDMKHVRNPSTTSSIDEYYASTRAYPPWWSDIEDSRILKRKKSGVEPILERNICFIDTPGYSEGDSFQSSVRPVVRYMEEHLAASSSLHMRDEDIINMMSGDGGSQVDVILYLIHQELSPLDMTYLEMLVPLANIIPVLVKTEDLTPQQVQKQRTHVLEKLASASIRPFLFRETPEQASKASSTAPPYAISTRDGNDHEIMDASLLMSPEYVSPLVPSQLSNLVEQIFDSDSISWLRHLTTKRYIHNRTTSTTLRSHSFSTAMRPRRSTIGRSTSITEPLILKSKNTFANAKLSDTALREERLAQIELSRWSTNLQQLMYSERTRFDALARGERAEWLIQRMNETIQDGQIVSRLSSQANVGMRYEHAIACSNDNSKPRLKNGGRHARAGTWASSGMLTDDREDLHRLREQMWRRTLAILGGFGVFGGLAWFLGQDGLRVLVSGTPWAGWTMP